MSASAIEFKPREALSSGKPGLYIGVPFDDYLAIDALSNSFLCAFERSPANAIWAKHAPSFDGDSAADLGSLVHTIALEPEEVRNRYAVLPKVNMRTNEGKEKAADFLASAESAGLEVISEDVFIKARRMAKSMMAHPEFERLLKAENGHSEVTVIWIDQETGLKCKARCDRLVPVLGGAAVLDIKTTDKIDRLKWSVLDYGYDRQEAHYSEGLRAVGFDDVWFFFGFISSRMELKRYPARFVQLNAEMKAAAIEAQRNRLARYLSASEFNDFYGVETI
jgi:signal transduction histidine kinase